MSKVRCFVSFDYDNDLSQYNLLIGQSKKDDSPFEIADWSIKEAISSDWEEKAKQKIRQCQVVIVLCGKNTHAATGVAKELKIAQDEGVDYFLLNAYGDDSGKTKPTTARQADKVYDWTWDNLKVLIHGGR
jgi:hypothetical protein